MPVESTIGRPEAAASRSRPWFVRSAEAIFTPSTGYSRSTRMDGASHGVHIRATPASRTWSNTRTMSSAESENLASSSRVRWAPRSSPAVAAPDCRYRASMSRSWNFTASAPASTARSTRRRARSTSPWWLLPISAIRNAGWPSPIRCPPIRSSASRLIARAVRRPRSSSSGRCSAPAGRASRISAGEAPRDAVAGSRWATSAAATSSDASGCATSQRRTSPSVREPTRKPWVSTTNTVRSRLSVIFCRAARSESSGKTR